MVHLDMRGGSWVCSLNAQSASCCMYALPSFSVRFRFFWDVVCSLKLSGHYFSPVWLPSLSKVSLKREKRKLGRIFHYSTFGSKNARHITPWVASWRANEDYFSTMTPEILWYFEAAGVFSSEEPALQWFFTHILSSDLATCAPEAVKRSDI